MRGPKETMVLSRWTDTDDGMGSGTRLWSDQRNISGVFWVLKGYEKVAYSKITDEITHKFAFNNLIGETVTTKDRLRLGTRLFDIKLVDPGTSHGNFTVLLLRELTT